MATTLDLEPTRLLPSSELLGCTDKDLYTNQEFLRYLVESADERARKLEDIGHLIACLPHDRPIHILCDYDVIKDFISVDSRKKSTPFTIWTFFPNLKFRFSIPGGAFRELVDANQDLLSETKPTTTETRDQLWTFLIHGTSEKNGSRVDYEDTILGLNDTIFRIERLETFLSHPQFSHEVTSQYGEDELKMAQELVSGLPRQDLERRKERDRNDAVNLAVVLTQCLKNRTKDKQTPNDPHFILVTRTKLVLQAANSLRSRTARLAIALDPDHILILGWFGFHRDPTLARATAIKLKRELRRLSESCSNLLTALQSPDQHPDQHEDISDIIQTITDAQYSINSAANNLLSGPLAQKFFLFEMKHGNLLAANRNQEQIDSLPDFDLMKASTRFLKAVERIRLSFSKFSPINYKVVPIDSKGTHLRWRVELAENCGSNPDNVLLINSFGDKNGKQQFWSASFTHKGGEVDLVRFCQDVIDPGSAFSYELLNHASSASFNFEPTDDDIEAPNQVIIFTSTGAFTIRPHALINSKWSVLRLYELRMLMKNERFSGSDSLPEVQAIRIHCRYADILFEIIPDTPDRGALVNIISTNYVPGLVVKSLDYFGSRLIFPSQLFTAIQDIIPKHLQHLDPFSSL